MTIEALKQRFDELLAQADELEERSWKERGASYVDNESYVGWRVKARNMLSRACGSESEHYRDFVRIADEKQVGFTNHDRLKLLKAVFLAAQEDHEGGYLRSPRSFAHAELFDDELEQATEFLANGYAAPAAVIARVVLETTLRTLCGDCKPVIAVKSPAGKWLKLEDLNVALAKGGVYTVTVQKEVTALAGVGNDAAHGHPINEAAVRDMIARVRRFVTDHPTA